jgi:hypothetical protein
VAVEKGTKKVILGEPAPFLKRIFNDLRTDFRAIASSRTVFQQPRLISTIKQLSPIALRVALNRVWHLL